ncbi:TFIIS helical bundle-like domain-containing protein [Ditylenchus destructor]|uniref:TFIIS helical bundle-like domain-containing protein n=1 Tax=Ditylenchus destructor TaxID=166010 RepID=A0AAD4RBG8_9BILA|nr:TFIIS helical bundle-like domain-containing protein [Ditylenchus destructor]
MDTFMENETVESSNATGPRTPEGIQGDLEENGGSDGAHTPLSQTGLDEQFNEGNPASPAHSDADNDENEAVDSDSNEAIPSPKKARRNIVQSDDEDEDNRDENGSASPKEVTPNEGTIGPTRTVIIDEDEEDNQENGNGEDVDESDSPTKSTPRKSRVVDSDDEDREEDISKKSKQIFGSDSDDDSDKGDDEKKKTKMLANIFGDDISDEEKEPEDKEKETNEEKPVDSDEGDAKFLRVEGDSDDGGKEWDFDIMLRKKRSEKKRRRHNKDSILLISDSDDKVQALVQAMGEAANEDRVSNQDKRPAIQKRKLLPMVRSMLLKADLFETLLDNGMMSGISEWLAPLPDKSLPALEVRSTLLKILESYPRLEQGILKQSGLGKAVMFLFKHPKETKENKTIAAKLIREWSRPIFQLDTDFRSVSREERLQRDYAHMPEAKRRRISLDADGVPNPSSRTRNRSGSDSGDESADQSDLRPGQVGFINRARVPKPSTRDYVIRPKSTIEGRFQGPSKSRQTDRFERAQREFRERNRAQKAKRAIGVNIAGNKMDI